MKTVTVDISKIRPYENNPRNNDGAVNAVADNLSEKKVMAYRLAGI